MKKQLKYVLITLSLILIFGIGAWSTQNFSQLPPLPNTTNTAPQETPPPQVKIIISSPLPNQVITTPLIIQGQARGSWFFEAQAPVKLVDETGNLLAQGNIKAEGNWQTNDFVPFSGTLTFQTPKTAKGSLILERDNPSGLPQNSDQVNIPIRFH